MARKMLRFAKVEQRLPDKREAEARRHDFEEIYADFEPPRPTSRRAAARSAACRSARSTARSTTTSPTG